MSQETTPGGALPQPGQPFERHVRRGSPLSGGLILIFIGVILLIQQFGGGGIHNWWALFILIPAFSSFIAAWELYRRVGRVNAAVLSEVAGGAIVLTVALIFLLGLNWAQWWPAMVIMPGLSMLASGFPLDEERERPLWKRLYRPWVGWFGAGVTLVGLGFIAANLGIIDLFAIFPRWWALALLVPAAGGLLTFLRLTREESPAWAGIATLISAFTFGAVGGIALLGAGWNLLAPILLIGAGILVMAGVFSKRS